MSIFNKRAICLLVSLASLLIVSSDALASISSASTVSLTKIRTEVTNDFNNLNAAFKPFGSQLSEIGSGGSTSINHLSNICFPFAKALASLQAALPNQFKSLRGTSYYADATYLSIAADEWEGQLTAGLKNVPATNSGITHWVKKLAIDEEAFFKADIALRKQLGLKPPKTDF